MVDVSISVTLVLLLRGRVAGFNARTDGILRSLVQLAILTGLPTTILAVTAAGLSFSFPDAGAGVNSPFAFHREFDCFTLETLI